MLERVDLLVIAGGERLLVHDSVIHGPSAADDRSAAVVTHGDGGLQFAAIDHLLGNARHAKVEAEGRRLPKAVESVHPVFKQSHLTGSREPRGLDLTRGGKRLKGSSVWKFASFGLDFRAIPHAKHRRC